MDIDNTIKFSPSTQEGSWNIVMIESENVAHDFADEKYCKGNNDVPKTKVDTLKLYDQCYDEFQIVHGLRPRNQSFFQCKFCKRNLFTEGDMRKHLMIHEKREYYICDICSKSYRRKYNLSEHLRRHYCIRHHKFDVCGKGFVCASFCKAHMRTHTGERPLEFDICKKKFGLRNTMKSHIIMSHVESNKPYNCLLCTQRFKTAARLEDHKLTHSGVKPFSCDVCSKRFTRKHNLKNHEKLHLDKKAYKCKTCGKGFNKSVHLISHLQLCLTGEKPYQCDICKKRFSYHSSMKEHILNNMKDGGHRKCPVCLLRSLTTEDLISHIKIHYPDGTSESEFSRLKHITSPMLSRKCRNRFICDICAKVFLRRSSFDAHVNTRSNLPNGKPYLECSMCKQKFCHNRTLAVHEKIEHYAPPNYVTRSDEGEVNFRQNNFQTGNLKTYERNRNLRVQSELGKVTEKEHSILCPVKKEPDDRLDFSCEMSPIQMKRKSESGSSASNSNGTSMKGEIDVQQINFQRVHLKTYQRKKKIISGHILDNHSDHTSVVVKTESESDVQDKEDINFFQEQQGLEKITESENSILLFPLIKKETVDSLDLSYEIEVSDVKIEIEEG